jgi:hypothetical protein
VIYCWLFSLLSAMTPSRTCCRPTVAASPRRNNNAAKDREENGVDNIKSVSGKGGTGRTYTIRRLKRNG